MSTVKQQIESDLKKALLEGNKELALTLRGLKSAILYEEVAVGKRDTGLDDQDVITVLQKEAKKRQDSADLYDQGGNTAKRDQELAEKEVIAKYLPAALTDEELNALVDEAIEKAGVLSQQTMGIVIGQVKEAAGAKADGGRIAGVVRERLAK